LLEESLSEYVTACRNVWCLTIPIPIFSQCCLTFFLAFLILSKFLWIILYVLYLRTIYRLANANLECRFSKKKMMNHDVSISDFSFVACIFKRLDRKIFLIHTVAVTAFISAMIDFPSDDVKTRPSCRECRYRTVVCVIFIIKQK